MSKHVSELESSDNAVQAIRAELETGEVSRGRRISEKFFIAALGAIPWIGGLIAAAATIPSGEKAVKGDHLRTQWLEEHQDRLRQLQATINEINDRFENLGSDIEERIQSPEYLALVRQAFRAWDESQTEEKRRFIANLLCNAAGTRWCNDDVIRLFITWIDLYHEAHFAVIRELYQNPGSTRFGVWTEVYRDLPREDSAEADLYKMLIRDLSTGGVIRQTRDINEAGQFMRKKPAKRRGPAPRVMESAFEDTKPYVLTELGKQFVHYTMNEVVSRLDES